MELAGELSSASKLQRLKNDLKLWERKFQQQNGRVPSKQDIQASSSIHSLYQEYARTKFKIQKENDSAKVVTENVKHIRAKEKENVHTGLPGDGRGTSYGTQTYFRPEISLRSSAKEVAELKVEERVELIDHMPNSRRLMFPATSSNSEDSEGGSYVLATPPKRAGSEPDSHSTPISSYRPVRRPLQEMLAGRLNERIRAPCPTQSVSAKVLDLCEAVNTCKRKAPETDAPKKFTPTGAVGSSGRVLSNNGNTLPAFEFPQEQGFVIKRRRPGMQFDEQDLYREHDPLPAGFSASILGSSLTRKECQRSGEVLSEATFKVDSRTPEESAAANSVTLAHSLGIQQSNEGTGEIHAAFDNCSHISPVACHSSPKPQDKLTSACQQLPINLPEIVPAGNSHPRSNTEVDVKVTAGDLDKELSESALKKLTVVILKQMLVKRGLLSAGNKSTLISRLTLALSSEVADMPLTVRVDGKSYEQGKTEKATVEPQLVDTADDTASNGAGRAESYRKADLVEPSLDSVAPISITGGKLVSASVVVSARWRSKTGHCPVRADENVPSSSEKIQSTSDLLPEGDVEVAGSVRTSKRVKRRTPQDMELPVIPQDDGNEDTSCPGNVDPLISLSVAPAGDGSGSLAPESRNKRIKIEKQPEEQSWSKPKALKRQSVTQKKNTTIRRSSARGSIHTQALKPCERDNFVKLNINGRSGGRRKFGNKTRFKKPGAYGRRGFRAKKYRRPAFEEADDVLEHDLLHADEVDANGPSKQVSRFNRSKSTVMERDTLAEAAASRVSVPDCTEESKAYLAHGLSEALQRVRQDPSNNNMLEVLELAFGFKAFRAGQLEAINRILALQSTMVMLPTGAGKSLCYQLPALIMPGVTLVISPLIALMTDQLRHLPPSLSGAVMSSAQTPQESSSTISRLRAGLIKVLFISPERLCGESFQRVLAEIPKINLAVIDEAHCLSEWSHNFRPSYFRLGNVLLQQMKVPCIIAMTATATKRAELSIMEALHIPHTGLVQTSHVRDNLVLTVSKEPNRLRALLKMLQESPYSEARSIIIYCTFQVEADNIGDFLQQSGIQAKSYHAKKTSQERSRILDHFCSNKLRVVVATVAFGMGLDKSDVGAVIHYNMPRSFEHYVQETGRAGRDGKPAFCHLFLDDNDYLKLRSLAHSEGVDEYAVGKVLARIFHGKQESSELVNPSSIVVETAVKEFDMKEEVLETILSYLEVGDVQYVKCVSKLNVTCSLSFYRSSPASLAETSSLVAAILKKSQERQGRYVFGMLSLAVHLKQSMFDMQCELRRLQLAGEIACDYGDPAFCFTVSRFPEDICLLTSAMTKRLNEVETSKVRKVDSMYTAALSVVCSRNEEVSKASTSSSSEQASFQASIKHYFEEDEDSLPSQQLPSIIEPSRNFLRADIKDFIRSNKHVSLTGRAVARIFYGVWSPAFPYSDWSKNHSWGKYEGVDFGVIKEIATAEILRQHSATRVLQNS